MYLLSETGVNLEGAEAVVAVVPLDLLGHLTDPSRAVADVQARHEPIAELLPQLLQVQADLVGLLARGRVRQHISGFPRPAVPSRDSAAGPPRRLRDQSPSAKTSERARG